MPSVVRVRNLPDTANSDKIEIHFSKRKNSGGDVSYVLFPLNSTEQDTAIVEFEEDNVADRVVKKEHVFQKALLVVKKETQVFSEVKAVVSAEVLNKIEGYGNIDDELEYLKAETAVDISSDSDEVTLTGSWYQIQAAKDLLQLRIAKLAGDTKGYEKTVPSLPSSAPRQNASAFMKNAENNLDSSSMNDKSLNFSDNDNTSEDENEPLDSSYRDEHTSVAEADKFSKRSVEIHSFVADRDIYEFAVLTESSALSNIWKRGIEPVVDLKDDAVSFTLLDMVPVNQDALNSQVLDACKREEREYQRFATDLEGNVHQDVIEVASLAKSTVKNAVTQLKKKYPTTHCRQMVSDESGQVIIISQMKEELEAAKQYFAKSAGINAWRNVQAFTVDRDIFEYIQEFFPDRFNEIKSEYGAEWHLKEISDEIQIQARQKDDGKSGKQFSTDGSNFKSAIMDVIDKIQQESEYSHSGFTLSELDFTTSDKVVGDAFKLFRDQFNGVYARRSCDDPDQIVFISNGKDKVTLVSDWFKDYLTKHQNEGFLNVPGGKGAGDAKPQSDTFSDDMSVDCDIYQYMQMVNGIKLQQMWKKHGVKLSVKETGDSAVITVFAPRIHQDDVLDAVREFQTLYQDTMDSVGQESLDLKDCGKPSEAAIADTIRAIRMETQNVYIGRSKDMPNIIIFIAQDRTELATMKQIFESVLRQKAIHMK